MRAAIYPGSFDPLTNGHLSLIQRGLEVFDTVVVAIAVNPKKTPLFTVEERVAMVRELVEGVVRDEPGAALLLSGPPGRGLILRRIVAEGVVMTERCCRG